MILPARVLRTIQTIAAVAFFSAICESASGQEIRGPEAAPLPPPIAAPVDRPYPGTIDLLIDATDVQHRVINVHETMPVESGDLTLLYPRWIPGTHSPTGPISS